jgi:outer membrane murein-binding lipoprotein Lpp
MKIKIVFTLAAVALGAALSGCMSANEEADWQSQHQINNAERAQSQAQIQADRVQRENAQQYGQ